MKDDILSSVIFEIYKNFAMFEISVEDGMSELVFLYFSKWRLFLLLFYFSDQYESSQFTSSQALWLLVLKAQPIYFYFLIPNLRFREFQRI